MFALKIILIIVSITLIASVLLQSGKSAGLGSISGGADQMLGGQGRNWDKVLSKVTTGAAILFIVMNLIIAAI